MAAKNGSNGTGTVDVSEAIAAHVAANEAATNAGNEARTALETRLAELKLEQGTLVEQLRSLGGKAGGPRARRGKRASNDVSLIVAVATVLSKAKESLSPTEICERVIKGGYVTDSENYNQMVSQALSLLKTLRIRKSPVAINPNRGEWASGSGMVAYLASPDDAVVAPSAKD